MSFALIPYFYEKSGQIDKARKFLAVYKGCYSQIGAVQEFEQALKDLGVQDQICIPNFICMLIVSIVALTPCS